MRGVKSMNSRKGALEMLKETSRTFYIPISRLPAELFEAVASAYLCMRAIDEIEDHPELDPSVKAKLLRQISIQLQTGREDTTLQNFSFGLHHDSQLPEVSLRLAEWALLAPPSIAPRVWDATAAMADRMAYWAENNWRIEKESDLDAYTFSVAGAVGLLLSDIFSWFDGTQTDRTLAIGFGRGLQAVNILRNHKEDHKRGVTFLPPDWQRNQLFDYTRRNLKLGDAFIKDLPKGPTLNFCKIPLTLAHATLRVMALGKEKLTRSDVEDLVKQASEET
jgi:farnesyl-diphosphate farnesyltransferase